MSKFVLGSAVLACLTAGVVLGARAEPAPTAPPPGRGPTPRPAPPPGRPEPVRFGPFHPAPRPGGREVKSRAGVRPPAHPFTLARRGGRGCRPNPPADPRALIRRVTYDL